MKFTLAASAATIAVLLTGGVTGVFLAFSVAVMPGLDAVKAGTAITAAQSMNQKILNPVFLTHFTGAPLAALATGGALLLLGQRSAAILFFVAAGIYLLGAFLPTMLVNVPLNEKLDATKIPSDPAEAARIWADFSSRWTPWNTLRAVSSVLSLLVMALGPYVWGRNH
ncbi:anthrone oxygenase family protein [Spirillospora sp. NPDC029432]|uniref:anthrone oxygenase family protein n=1 Tax=Spirillospora sp. NPDC029432 TaxID=3154599 RepID=UPI003451BB82